MSKLIDPRLWEVPWYRQHGKYPSRIVKDSNGEEYVIGDWSWHAKYPNNREYIEGALRDYGNQYKAGMAESAASEQPTQRREG